VQYFIALQAEALTVATLRIPSLICYVRFSDKASVQDREEDDENERKEMNRQEGKIRRKQDR
jgi:hypothetical protein